MAERGWRSSAPEWALAGVALLASSLLLLMWQRGRRKGRLEKDISVPEALHTLAHGPLAKRVAAARALSGILNGEVQVLEEVLDEARGAHPEFSTRRLDGLSIFGVVLADLAGNSSLDACSTGTGAEALVNFLLQCTAYDSAWDDSDEWNQMTKQVVAHLRDREGAEARVAAAEARHGANGALLARIRALRRRLQGERAAAAAACAQADAPGMLSMNTRVSCPVCMAVVAAGATSTLRCPQCRNVGYCSPEHLREDAERHGEWCFGVGQALG